MARVTGRPVEIEYEPFGHPDDPALVLISGLGSQMLTWDEELCQGFVDRGFHVIRLDNRDSGLSTIMPADASYDIADMGDDVVAVLDGAGVDKAIVCGFSLGGYIARSVAIEHPERVAGLVSVGSTTGEPDVGQPTGEAQAALRADEATALDGRIEQMLAGYRIWSNPEWRDEVWYREFLVRAHGRAWHPGAEKRQLDAHDNHRPQVDEMRALDVPTLVVHGELDTLVDPSGGRRTAELIPGAEYLELEGFAHVLAPQMWAPLISAVTALASRAAW